MNLNRLLLVLTLLTAIFTVRAQDWNQKGLDINGAATTDQAGRSTDISADGQTIIIGSLGNDIGGLNSGQVRVYDWDGSSWIQKGNDVNGTINESALGFSVSMSSDGNTFIAGAPNYGQGHVKIYEWNGTSWVQKGITITGEYSNDYFGENISLSSDGNLFAVGAGGNNGNGTDSGHARVYEWNGTSWMQKGSDIDGENSGDGSGVVSLSSDGNILAIGAIANDDNGSYAGHVRVFEWSGSSWVQKGSDIDGSINSWFGIAVSLSSSGTSLAIGADHDDENYMDAGKAKVFDWSGTAWVQRGNDLQGENGSDWFGGSVNLSSDGNILAVGAVGYDYGGSNSGRVKIFKWNGTAWVQKGTDIYGEAPGDRSGNWVSLSENTNTIVIGAPRNADNGVNAGHARVYSYASYSTINEVACDNYTSPSGNYNWLTSGTYTDTIQSVIGTDSIITINLTINPLSNSSSDHSICSNTDFTYADGTEHTSITSDETYISTLTGQAANGCDSIVTENITVLTVDVSVTEDGITITANLSGENYQWIDCNDNNSLISGETNPSFTALINGSYAVIINDGTCSDTSACIMVNSVEIHELDDASSIIIYPNPSIGQITVESPNAVQVEIYNLSGVLIKRTNKKELDLSQEAKGIYFVKLITKINIETTKLIIE